MENPLFENFIIYGAKGKKSNKSGNFGTPNSVFVTLGFFCTFQAEKFVLIPELRRHRAGGADTALIFRDTHEALPFYAEDHFFSFLAHLL